MPDENSPSFVGRIAFGPTDPTPPGYRAWADAGLRGGMHPGAFPVDFAEPDPAPAPPPVGDSWPRHLFLAEVEWLPVDDPVLIPDERDLPAPPPRPSLWSRRHVRVLAMLSAWAAAGLLTYLLHLHLP